MFQHLNRYALCAVRAAAKCIATATIRAAVMAALRSAARVVSCLWSRHCDLIGSNPAYAAAVASAAATLATRTNVADLVAAAVAGLLAVLTAIRRSVDSVFPATRFGPGDWPQPDWA